MGGVWSAPPLLISRSSTLRYPRGQGQGQGHAPHRRCPALGGQGCGWGHSCRGAWEIKPFSSSYQKGALGEATEKVQLLPTRMGRGGPSPTTLLPRG